MLYLWGHEMIAYQSYWRNVIHIFPGLSLVTQSENGKIEIFWKENQPQKTAVEDRLLDLEVEMASKRINLGNRLREIEYRLLDLEAKMAFKN